MNEHRGVLVPVLEEARRLGFLGPGPVEAHLDHAAGYAAALEADAGAGWAPARAADLGSGAGLPGLPLALRFPGTEWTLVEASVRRAAFLRAAVRDLGLGERLAVVEERAEVVGRA
ncbi:MAG: class I SAM-dependent methyltransferase, partial [Acidimicrobiales bacterium]|nr:class I SAM-dependent methyltransferase [Acidimicrobiales bacterium]